MSELIPFSQIPFLSQALSRREALALSAKLLGGMLSASVIRAVSADTPPPEPVRNVFPGNTRSIMEELTEMIIPKTDTPGALDVGVPAFVEKIVAGWYSAQERKTFIDGLLAIDGWCRDHKGKPFLECSEADKVEALKAFEKEAQKQQAADGQAMPFFAQIKELTAVGYCSSELVSTQVFRYLPVPGHYDGHYPAAKVGGTRWTY